MEILEKILEYFLDAIECFWDGLKQPTAKYTLGAFLVSLVFLAYSIIAPNLGFDKNFVEWQEAAICSSLLLIVTLIDSSNRAAMKNRANMVLTASKQTTNMIQSAVSSIKKNNVDSDVYEDEEYYENSDEEYYEDDSQDEYYEDDYQEEYYEDEEYYDESEEDDYDNE